MRSQQEPQAQDEPKKTVLVVEDEVSLRFVISSVLREDANLTVIEAENADEALAVLRSGPTVDAVFTDIRMPGRLDGIALTRLVLDEFPDVRVATASGNLTEGERLTGVRHFAKPYDIDAVMAHILALIDEAG